MARDATSCFKASACLCCGQRCLLQGMYAYACQMCVMHFHSRQRQSTVESLSSSPAAAPTGSGKSNVACVLMLRALRLDPARKAMLVRRTPLPGTSSLGRPGGSREVRRHLPGTLLISSLWPACSMPLCAGAAPEASLSGAGRHAGPNGGKAEPGGEPPAPACQTFTRATRSRSVQDHTALVCGSGAVTVPSVAFRLLHTACVSK
jgi:hypothetical protein